MKDTYMEIWYIFSVCKTLKTKQYFLELVQQLSANRYTSFTQCLIVKENLINYGSLTEPQI